MPQANLDNRVTPVLVGNCVGGSSAINGMALMRGSARDYDIWAELGGPGSTWNWEGILPYFKKVSHHRRYRRQTDRQTDRPRLSRTEQADT